VELAMIGPEAVGSPATQFQAGELVPLNYAGGSSGAAQQVCSRVDAGDGREAIGMSFAGIGIAGIILVIIIFIVA
jgi:hypothetical protein